MSVFLCGESSIGPVGCQNCGGSATLGGTQDALWTDGGTFCSDECYEEHIEFCARQDEARRRRLTVCSDCGFDNSEHAVDCSLPRTGGES